MYIYSYNLTFVFYEFYLHYFLIIFIIIVNLDIYITYNVPKLFDFVSPIIYIYRLCLKTYYMYNIVKYSSSNSLFLTSFPTNHQAKLRAGIVTCEFIFIYK